MPFRRLATSIETHKVRGTAGFVLATGLMAIGILLDRAVGDVVSADSPHVMVLLPLLAVGALCGRGPILLAVALSGAAVTYNSVLANNPTTEIVTTALASTLAAALVAGTVHILMRGWTMAALAQREADALRLTAERHAAEAEAARTEAEASARRAEMLQGELRHRMRNLLGVIGGLASASFRSGDQKVNLRQFRGRLAAHIAANELVFGQARDEIGLHLLARTVLSSFPLDRLDMSETDAPIAASRASVLGLALHELGTNAQKYGAWSTEAGRVRLCVESGEDGSIDYIEWRETGGPPPAPEDAATRRGFGTTLLGQMLSGAMGGTIHREMRPEGLLWRFELSASGDAAAAE